MVPKNSTRRRERVGPRPGGSVRASQRIWLESAWDVFCLRSDCESVAMMASGKGPPAGGATARSTADCKHPGKNKSRLSVTRRMVISRRASYERRALAAGEPLNAAFQITKPDSLHKMFQFP